MSNNIEAKQAWPIVSEAMLKGAQFAVDGVQSIASSIVSVANKVYSEDSQLSSAFSKYRSTLEMIANAINATLKELDKGWEEWCQATIANEEGHTNTVEGIEGEISAIADTVSGIVDGALSGLFVKGSTEGQSNSEYFDNIGKDVAENWNRFEHIQGPVTDMNGNYTDAEGNRHNISDTSWAHTDGTGNWWNPTTGESIDGPYDSMYLKNNTYSQNEQPTPKF